MQGFLNWLEAWSQRRAEKNRRFKIPCHLGVTGMVADDPARQGIRNDQTRDAPHSAGQRVLDSARIGPRTTTDRCDQ